MARWRGQARVFPWWCCMMRVCVLQEYVTRRPLHQYATAAAEESTQAFLTPTEWAHAGTYTRTPIPLTQIPRHKGENRGETASMNSSALLQTQVHLALMFLNPIINADHQIPQSHRKRKIVWVRDSTPQREINGFNGGLLHHKTHFHHSCGLVGVCDS